MTDRITNIDGKEYTIDGCCDCPFYDNGDNGYGDHCQYPEKPSEHPAELCLTPPDDCPLRKSQEKSNKVNLTLKPCPFCGSIADAQRITGTDQYRVICTNPECHAVVYAPYAVGNGSVIAIERWNRRVIE